MEKFLAGTKIIIEVVFDGEYRIGWEYEGIKYVPGFASYYNYEVAMAKAWEAFCDNFPHLTQRADRPAEQGNLYADASADEYEGTTFNPKKYGSSRPNRSAGG